MRVITTTTTTINIQVQKADDDDDQQSTYYTKGIDDRHSNQHFLYVIKNKCDHHKQLTIIDGSKQQATYNI